MVSWLIKLFLSVLVVGVALRFIPALPIASTVTQKTDLFTVSGEGKVTVVPDTAIIDLGILSTKSTVKLAQNEANTVISEITKSLKEMGISEKDIKTSNYSVYPQYDYQSGTVNKITGYQVNANITVTVREIDKANNVIDTATSKGANTVGGIQLTVDENKRKELLQEAREKAISEAKSKAESLSKAAGLNLGKIINVQEDNMPSVAPMFARVANDKAMGGGGQETDINPGSADITSSVTLFYETR